MMAILNSCGNRHAGFSEARRAEENPGDQLNTNWTAEVII